MTVYANEMKRSLKALIIWSLAIGAMIMICIAMFPDLKNETEKMGSMFANMGSFTDAFGMDKLDFGQLMGFYGIECGNVLGIGGGMFAALAGISALANEEKEHTAEFLLTHPVSRASVMIQKLAAALTQVVVLNMFTVCASLATAAAVGESFDKKQFVLIHAAFLVMQAELCCIAFGISAFIKRGSLGIGLGLALAMYFMNLLCNMSSDAEFLKYVTPYAYAEPSDIISENAVDGALMAVGCCLAAAGAVTAFIKYGKKDISA
ncbi:MAG: ABC transporter permease subunit [Ruminococcus sp.]|nr:ABC transporter permease subunit [Ruminococcus sp.]